MLEAIEDGGAGRRWVSLMMVVSTAGAVEAE